MSERTKKVKIVSDNLLISEHTMQEILGEFMCYELDGKSKQNQMQINITNHLKDALVHIKAAKESLALSEIEIKTNSMEDLKAKIKTNVGSMKSEFKKLFTK